MLTSCFSSVLSHLRHSEVETPKNEMPLQKGTRYQPHTSHKVYYDYDLPLNNTTPSTAALFATVIPRWPRPVPVLSVTSTVNTSSAPPRLRMVHSIAIPNNPQSCSKLVISLVHQRKIKHSVNRQNGRQTYQSHLSKMRLEFRR